MAETSIGQNLIPIQNSFDASVQSANSAVSELGALADSDSLFAEVIQESVNCDSFSQAVDSIISQGSEINAQTTEQESLKNEANTQLETTNTDLNETATQISETTSQISDIDSDISNIESNISSLQSSANQLKAASGEDEGYKAQAASIQSQISNLQNQVESLKTEKMGLENQKADQETKKASLEEEKARIENEISNIEAQIKELEGQAQSLQSQADGNASQGQSGQQQAEQTEAKAEQAQQQAVQQQAEQPQAQVQEQPQAQVQEQPQAQVQPQVQQVATPASETVVSQAQSVETPVADENSTIANDEDTTKFDDIISDDVMERIENNEQTDELMADVIVNDMFDIETLTLNAEDVIGIDAKDAIDMVSESYKAELYSNNVYTQKVSDKTDTATIDENQEAISDFMDAFSGARAKFSSANTAFLSLTDKSNYEGLSKLQERLVDGEYVLTKEIEKSTTIAKTIQNSIETSKNSEDKSAATKGESLLSQMKEKITDDKSIQDNKNDDVLTQNEYDKDENFFEATDDKAQAFKDMAKEAMQYGIYALAA